MAGSGGEQGPSCPSQCVGQGAEAWASLCATKLVAGVGGATSHPPGPCPDCPYLCPVWEEDGTCKVACDATENEDDGNAVPASQLFQVAQDGHLEDHRYEAVHQAGDQVQRAWSALWDCWIRQAGDQMSTLLPSM